MVDNFAACFDMLGFRSAVLKNFNQAWGALSDLWFALDKALSTVAIPVDTGVPLVDRVRAHFFSDSVVLYTSYDLEEDLIAILIAAGTLFGESLRTCVPLRGGVGHGKFQMDPDKVIFMGESLVRAHDIGEDAQWLGILLDEEIAKRAIKTSLKEYVVTWQVPRRNGDQGSRYVLDWVKPYADAGNLKLPITTADFYQAFEALSGPYLALPPEVRRKYENTVAFINARPSA